jgi:hypothetical protein
MNIFMAIPGSVSGHPIRPVGLAWSQSLSSSKVNTRRLLDPIYSQISEGSVSDLALRDITRTNLSGETEATKMKLDCKGQELY